MSNIETYGKKRMEVKMDEKISKKIKQIGIPLLIYAGILIILCSSIYTVKAGYRGVLLTFGKPSMETKDEGLHFKVPVAQTVAKLEVRKQKIEVVADSASKDLQDVQTTIALNFHLEPDTVPSLYQQIGMDYKSRIIDPAIQESVKAVTAIYVAEELITKRPKVREDMRILLKEKLTKYFIKVDDFNIVNFQFSAEFDKAIESKVTAEQLKLKAIMDLERIKVEKEQKITQAQAEAESLRLQRQEVTSELIQLRQIEMMMSAIQKWDGVMPQATAGMPFIDVSPGTFNVVK